MISIVKRMTQRKSYFCWK